MIMLFFFSFLLVLFFFPFRFTANINTTTQNNLDDIIAFHPLAHKGSHAHDKNEKENFSFPADCS